MEYNIAATAYALASTERKTAAVNNLTANTIPGRLRVSPTFEEMLMPQTANTDPIRLVHQTGTYIDLTEGSLEQTGNPFDFAANGGFFKIMTPNGDKITKDGRFEVNEAGELVTRVGRHPVLIDGSTLTLPTGYNISDVQVSTNGEIFHGTDYLGKFDLVRVESSRDITEDAEGFYALTGDPLPPFDENGIQTVLVHHKMLQGANFHYIQALEEMQNATLSLREALKVINNHKERAQRAANSYVETGL